MQNNMYETITSASLSDFNGQIETLKKKGYKPFGALQVTAVDRALYYSIIMHLPNDSFQKIVQDYTQWSTKTFKDADPSTSLTKLKEEIAEMACDVAEGKRPVEEYADAMMCILDSCARFKNPIGFYELMYAVAYKTEINKERKWQKNDNGTYSHVK